MKKVAKSKKHPKAEQEHNSNVVEQENVSVQPKKKGSEIDEIFAGKKRKRLENKKKDEVEKPAKAAAAANVRPLDKKKGKSIKSRSFKPNSSAVDTSQPRKRTVDGLSVFSEEELGIGKPDAGGTALCPFDCDCCF